MSTKPYYEDEQITLYLGDNREILEWTKCDALVTDPPYGRKWKQGSLHSWQQDWREDNHKGIKGDDSTELRDQVLQTWGDEKPAIVFGDLMLAPPIGVKQVLVYQKPFDAGRRGAMSNYRRDLEAVYLLGKWSSGISTGRGSLLTTIAPMISGTAGIAKKYRHPHAKPEDVLIGLMQNLDPASVIADPFAGSGTTLFAARSLGMKAVGVELEERYAKRAVHHLLQPSLFDQAVSLLFL